MLGLKFDLPTITILPLALILDIVPWILAFFVLDDLGICEILGLIFIEIPLLLLGVGQMGGKQKMTNNFVKTLKGPVGGLSALFAELIPIIDLLPLWTIYAYICLADLTELPIIGAYLKPKKQENDESSWRKLSQQIARRKSSNSLPS